MHRTDTHPKPNLNINRTRNRNWSKRHPIRTTPTQQGFWSPPYTAAGRNRSAVITLAQKTPLTGTAAGKNPKPANL
ncbi:hypothetical protein E2C01_102680 [Portunus trituberculatus]|uniref:Uncharacterized protein n=1 Tax=Portunus trituberculatus TaxID=210409 RepID=A0A5B7KNC7_PORTR|nr:hypothetical protein [Portunus trituberculatus]